MTATEAVIEQLRQELDTRPEMVMSEIREGFRSSPLPSNIPPSYMKFLQLADGMYCGTAVTLFDAARSTSQQFYTEPIEDCPLPITAERHFCIGLINENPIFLDRRDGGIWYPPDTTTLWWMNEGIKKLSDGVFDFLNEWIISTRYASLAELTHEDFDQDEWVTLLKEVGIDVDHPGE
ncbi:hypothetical protein ACYSUO_19065 [Streptomyces sp. UC4497]